jgi:hypothetical protein
VLSASRPASRGGSEKWDGVETKTPAGVSRPEWGVYIRLWTRRSPHRRRAHSTGAGLDTIGCQRKVVSGHLRLLSWSPWPSPREVARAARLRQREASCHRGYRLSTPQFLAIEHADEVPRGDNRDGLIRTKRQKLLVSGHQKVGIAADRGSQNKVVFWVTCFAADNDCD